MNKGALVVVAVAALVLVGCAQTPPHPSSRPHAPTPSASASAPPTKPALADVVLTPQGIGDIRLGQPVPADDPAIALVRWDPSACVSADGLSLGDPYAGLWHANYPDVNSQGASAFTLVTDGGTQGGPVDYIGVRDASAVHTATGVTVGSTLEALKAAYPGGFAQTAHGENGADVYVVGGASGVIAFDVSVPYPDDAGGWAAGDLNKVIEMNVFVPRSAVPVQPNFGTTNSGFCPD